MANNYRLIVVLNPSMGEEGLASLTESIKSKIESNGTIETVDVLGNQKMAYEIKNERNGYYVQINFTADSEFPKEIERVLKITEGVLRFIVVRVGE